MRSSFEQALEHVPGVLAVQMAQKGERRFYIRLVPSSEEERESFSHTLFLKRRTDSAAQSVKLAVRCLSCPVPVNYRRR